MEQSSKSSILYLLWYVCVSIINVMFGVKCIIFIGSVLVLFIVTLIRVVVTEFICLNAGRVLHNKYLLSILSLFFSLSHSLLNRMFRRFVRAPTSFFDMNPIGMSI